MTTGWVLVVLLAASVSAQDDSAVEARVKASCAGLGQNCTKPNTSNPACCAPNVCDPATYKCVAGGATTTTTTTTSTQEGASTTTATSSPTSTTDIDTAQFPAIRPAPNEVSWVGGAGNLAWYRGDYATQPQRAAMQGEMIMLVAGEMCRYTRRMPKSCASDFHQLGDLLLNVGTRFMTAKQYEGKVFPPYLEKWEIGVQGAGDLYQGGFYRPRGVQGCSLEDAERCAAAVTPGVLGYADMKIVTTTDPDGTVTRKCIAGGGFPVYTKDPANSTIGRTGMLNGAQNMGPLTAQETAALEHTHDVHMAQSAWRCDKSKPAPVAGAVDAAHQAYETLVGSRPGATAELQHFARMPAFSGTADTAANKHPLDPEGIVYWSDADECDWGKIEDQAHMKWVECEKTPRAGQWGICQMFARLHEFAHDCLTCRNDEYVNRWPTVHEPFPQLDTTDEYKATCSGYLKKFRDNGSQLP